MRFDELQVGLAAERERQVTEDMVRRYAELTGDLNPIHLDERVAAKSRFGTRVAHGMLSAGFVSAVLGMDLPGPGVIWLSYSIRFTRPVRLGDTVRARVEVKELFPERRRATLTTTCCDQHGNVVLDGEALVMMPEEPPSS